MPASTASAPMIVGANTMSFMWRSTAREALECLAREGYTRFEVMAQRPHFDPFMARPEAEALARFLRDAGLTVETLNIPSLDQNLASGVPQMREYTVAVFERLVELAACVGARGVIVVTGRVNPLVTPARADLEGWFGDSFGRVLRTAEREGVHLLLENIPMGVYPGAGALAAFADGLSHPLVEICYDIANAHFIGEDVAAGVHTVAKHLGIVHLSDTGRDKWRHDPVGEGTCDFAAFAAALRTLRYERTSMLEIVADPAPELIVASHRKLTPLGWSELRAPRT